MVTRRPIPILLASILILSLADQAAAWPADLSQRIAKDALKLLPKSLSELFIAHQDEIFADARATKMRSLPLVYQDLPKGKLTSATRTAISNEITDRMSALQGQDFRGAVIALGAMYRLSVDLADPAIGEELGADAKSKAIRREFYAYVTANLDKIPVVVVEPDSMKIKPDKIPGFLDDVAGKTPSQSALLRSEGQEDGKVLRASEIDFRSPVFAVASTAYSRSVSAVAATWIAMWRAAGGDMQRQKAPRIINPRNPQ